MKNTIVIMMRRSIIRKSLLLSHGPKYGRSAASAVHFLLSHFDVRGLDLRLASPADKDSPELSRIRFWEFDHVYPLFTCFMTLSERMIQYNTWVFSLTSPIRSSGMGRSNISKLSVSMTFADFPVTESTCAVFFSMMGISTLSEPGITRILFFPSISPTPSILTFAWPCLPGREVETFTILQAAPSSTTVIPSLTEVASSCFVDMKYG